jgi:hypothetical protein
MKIIQSSEAQTITNSDQFESHSFGIKTKNLPVLIGLLRNDVYSDKILAIIREYACNAYDANVEAGKADIPISISLPNKFEQNLKIRDYGNGLSHQEIVDTFISYGESTKRNTNDAIGQMGIGSKAGFCYTDSFIVTSFNSGTKTVYNCALGEDNVGSLIVMHSSPMSSTDKSGLEIVINIKLNDVEIVRKTALNFFKYWKVIPDINFSEEEQNQLKSDEIMFSGSNWKITSRNFYAKSYAVMGNIAYPIDWNNCFFAESNPSLSHFLDFIKSENFTLEVPIGMLQFSPSRESLQYTDYTKKTIESFVKQSFQEFKTNLSKVFQDCKNIFEAKSLYQNIFGGSNYYLNSLPKYLSLLCNGKEIKDSHITIHNNHLSLKDKKKWCFLFENYGGKIKQKYVRHGVDHIFCSKKTKLLLMDSRKTGERKAVELIFEKNNKINYVYVLKFQNDETKKEILSGEIGTFPIIKYSDLNEELKAYQTSPDKKEKVQYKKTKKVENVINVSSFKFRKNGHLEEIPVVVELNLKTQQGFYLKKANMKYESIFGDEFYRISNKLTSYKILSNDTALDNVYVFGQRVINSEDFKKNEKNWVEISQYVKTGLNNLLKDKSFSDYYAYCEAIKTLEPTKYLHFILVSNPLLLKELSNQEGLFSDFAAIKKTIEPIKNKVDQTNFHYEFAEHNKASIKNNELYKKLMKCFADLKAKYPIICYFNKSYSVEDKIIKNYIKDMDSLMYYKEEEILDKAIGK